MYIVDVDETAQQQIDALPPTALVTYAELRVMLETAPWNGAPYNRSKPEGSMRTHPFGTHDLAVYLISKPSARSWCSSRPKYGSRPSDPPHATRAHQPVSSRW